MAEQDDVYKHYRQMHDEILASGGTKNAARWWSTTAWWEERKKLSENAEFRTDAPEPESAYQGYEHQQLKRMVTEELSVSQVGDVSEAWSRLANAMADFGDRLHEQVTRSEAVWQGGAAESAKAYTSAMARWSEETGRSAQLVSHQVSMEGDAATAARDRMPDPVPFDLRQEMAGWQQNPQNMNALVLQTLQRQQAEQDAKQEAVAVMTDYDNNLRDAAARQPVFPPPPQLKHASTSSATSAIPSSATPSAGDAAQGTTTAAAFGPADTAGTAGGTGSGTGGGTGDELRRGRDFGRGHTNPAMPFHSGGTGVPAAAGPTGQSRAPMMPGFMGAPGGTARGDDDKEHLNSYVVDDWDREGYWYGDLAQPTTPVIGGDLLAPPADAHKDGTEPKKQPS